MDDKIEQLVIRAKAGDRTAFSDIVRITQQRLLSYAYPMLGSQQDAEDVVQEVYIRAYDHLPKYRRSESFTAWLHMICYRLCMNKLTNRSRLLRALPRMVNEALTNVSRDEPVPPSDDELALLEGLAPEDRNLVVLRVIHELSYKEISELVGRSEAALRKRYERIRKKLQAAHGTAWEPETASMNGLETGGGIRYDKISGNQLGR